MPEKVNRCLEPDSSFRNGETLPYTLTSVGIIMSKDVASNIVQIQTILEVKTENLVIQSVSCLAALLKHTMMYCSLVWQAEIFPAPFLFLLSPTASHPQPSL